jgi:glycosyltransferase involved in cell wall biosynthesis
MHDSNAVAFTWFHGDPEIDDASDGYAALLSGAADAADLVVTSSTLGAGVLKRYGVPDRKVRTIPLGVDTQHFKPSSRAEREATRESLEIPSDALCIGSFQKDGVGWGDGMQPKRVKGPDVFLETIGMLRDRFPIHVLLTGPARGYLKDGLGKLGVPFSHVYLKDFTEIPAYYGALDLYLVTSRDEGGPKGVLESMATGTPLVTTRVGMAPDIVVSGENGFMTESEDVDFLTERAGQLLESAGLREQFASKGLQTSAQYDWQTIGERYASDVYRPLMAS